MRLQLLLAATGLGCLTVLAPPLDAQSNSPQPAPAVPAAPGKPPFSAVVENSVVKVFATVRYPDYYKPWAKQAPSDITASGVVIEGKRILSNAHAVLYASEIQIEANQAGDKLPATVVAVAPGIDLAVLKLEDESFFDSHPPLRRAQTLPQVKDMVMAYGYPKGGSSLSITKGIVSRIEFAPYNYGTGGLRIQIDAAINPGNSGGPAVVNDKMVGLAFSRLAGSELIGYIIPCEEIELFLRDIADGHYDGKPTLPGEFQTLQNPALREFLRLPKSAQGVVVNKPGSDVPSYPLKPFDVITQIGGTPIDDEGMVKMNFDLRVMFTYALQRDAADGMLQLSILRSGEEKKVGLPVGPLKEPVIAPLMGAYPPYFVYGPLVFTAASQEFVAGFSGTAREWLITTGSSLISRLGDKPAFPDEQLVVVAAPFFPHKLAKGYASPVAQVVKMVNGTPVRNLKQMVGLLRDCTNEYVGFEFDQRKSETLIFPRAAMAAATDDILIDNGVRSQGSPDVLAVWNQAKTSK